LLGVMTHRNVRRGIILGTGDFTSDAKAFAMPNRIECISGPAFLDAFGVLLSRGRHARQSASIAMRESSYSKYQ
jgi:Restriction endonuclease